MSDFSVPHKPSVAPESAASPESVCGAKTAGEITGKESGRAIGVYALTLCLLALLESDRLCGFLERLELPGAAETSRVVSTVAELSGAELVARAEARLVGQMATAKKIGSVAANMVADAPLLPAGQKNSSEGTPASAPTTGTPVATPPPAQVSPSVEGTPSLSATPDAASVPPEPAVLPAPSGPPKVLIVGDSLIMEGLGPSLLRTLRKRGDLTVVREGRYSTGLTRTDTFDWPAHMRTLVAEQKPDIVIACLGANDSQDILLDGKRHIAGTESWQALYRQRADAFLAEATAGGAEVVWLGLPIMGSQTYEKRIRLIADLQAAACNNLAPLCRFQDGLPVLADAKGQYLSHGVDAQGKHVRLRYKDKIHVTEAGGQMMVDAAMPLLQEVIAPKLPPAPEQPATEPGPVPQPVAGPEVAPPTLSSPQLPVAPALP